MAKTNVYEILRKKYPEAEYALMKEVSDGAGFNRLRSADYIVMNLWPSRGLHLNGIELKSYRGDWLNELKNPAKAENIFQYCDFFWLLTEDETIAKIEEIPDNWGWMCIKNERIFCKKDAPKLNPKPISRDFLAAMLKRASNKSGFVLETEIDNRINNAFLQGENKNKKQVEDAKEELQRVKNLIKEFEHNSGISLNFFDRWSFGVDAKKMGEIFNFLHKDGGVDELERRLKILKGSAEEISKGINNGLQKLEQVSNQKVEVQD